MRLASFVPVLALVISALVAGDGRAQYVCAVAIEWKGQPILKGQIRDEERPTTDQLWQLLQTLSFAPTANGDKLPDPRTVEKTTLKGELRVKVDGAGKVDLQQLELVRNKYNPGAWVIAPTDVTRILKLRKAAGDDRAR